MRILTYAALVVALAYLVIVVQGLSADAWIAVLAMPAWVPVLMFMLLVLGHIIGAVHWHLAIGLYGRQRRFSDSMKIWTAARVGRYVPGRIAQYVARVSIYRGRHAVAEVLGASAVELVSAGFAVLAFGALALGPLTPGWSIVALCTACLLVVGIVGEGVAMRYREVAGSILNRWGGKALGSVVPRRGTLTDLVKVHGAGVLQVALYGAAFAVSTYGAEPLSVESAVVAAAAFSAGALFGQLVSVAPAGMGIREAAIVALLGGQLEPAAVLVAAILVRVGSICAELTILGGLSLGGFPRGDGDRTSR